MGNALSGAGLMIVEVLLTLATFFFLARFILQAMRADFYNPLSQSVVQLTDPVLRPLRRIIPGFAGLDMSSLLVAVLLQAVFLFAFGMAVVTALVIAPFRLLAFVLDIYFWCLLISVILSWVAPGSRHPGALLVYQITEPLLAPVRRVMPPAGGLDFSILVVFLILMVIRDFLLPGLAMEFGLPRAAIT